MTAVGSFASYHVRFSSLLWPVDTWVRRPGANSRRRAAVAQSERRPRTIRVTGSLTRRFTTTRDTRTMHQLAISDPKSL